jgi:hypothetical protein
MMTDNLTRIEHLETRLETLLRVVAIQLEAGPHASIDDLSKAIERVYLLEATVSSLQDIRA